MVFAAWVVAIHASHAQVGVARGTYVDRTSESGAQVSQGNQIAEAARAANAAADAKEQARVNSLRASIAREAEQKESRKAAADLALEKQMEKARQETYQYYKNASNSYFASAKIQKPKYSAESSAVEARKPAARPDRGRPECEIRRVMSDAMIAALRNCP